MFLAVVKQGQCSAFLTELSYCNTHPLPGLLSAVFYCTFVLLIGDLKCYSAEVLCSVPMHKLAILCLMEKMGSKLHSGMLVVIFMLTHQQYIFKRYLLTETHIKQSYVLIVDDKLLSETCRNLTLFLLGALDVHSDFKELNILKTGIILNLSGSESSLFTFFEEFDKCLFSNLFFLALAGLVL